MVAGCRVLLNLMSRGRNPKRLTASPVARRGIPKVHVLDDAIELAFPGRCFIRVPCVYTPCRFGGRRRWFSCPDCGRPCRAVYRLGDRVSCWICLHLRFASQLEPSHYRAIRRRDRIWRRLDGPRRTSFNDELPTMPKGMRWARFAELKLEYERLDRKSAGGRSFSRPIPMICPGQACGDEREQQRPWRSHRLKVRNGNQPYFIRPAHAEAGLFPLPRH